MSLALSKNVLKLSWIRCRNISTTKQRCRKVTLIGAAGGIGAPCLMLLKMNTMIKELNAVDMNKVIPGVGMDASHMNFPAKTRGFVSPEGLQEGLCNADIVVITAGVPRKPGMSRDDLFKVNADIIKSTAECCAEVCPDAFVVIVTNPLNSVVPIFCKVMEKQKKLNPNKIFGCTTLDNVRASTFVGQLKNIDPREICVPVVCGHSGETIVPIFSQTKGKIKIELKPNEVAELTKHVQDAGTEIVKAKAGGGSATLSMAFSAARFTNSILKAMKGETDVVECAYVKADIAGCKYFATPLILGPCGVQKNLGIPDLSTYEKCLLEKGIESLKKSIEKGEAYVK
nr:uncharacterized protein LOC111428206 [Onthophagus taurus]